MKIFYRLPKIYIRLFNDRIASIKSTVGNNLIGIYNSLSPIIDELGGKGTNAIILISHIVTIYTG